MRLPRNNTATKEWKKAEHEASAEQRERARRRTLVKCLRKRVGGPGLINACNVSGVKSEEEDAEEESRGIIGGGPLFASNIFIDWKRLFSDWETTFSSLAQVGPPFKKGRASLIKGSFATSSPIGIEISSIDENRGDEETSARKSKGRSFVRRRRVSRISCRSEATIPQSSLRLMRRKDQYYRMSSDRLSFFVLTSFNKHGLRNRRKRQKIGVCCLSGKVSLFAGKIERKMRTCDASAKQD